MSLGNDTLALCNAAAVGLSLICIALAVRAVRGGRVTAHRNWMLAAVVAQAIFSAGFIVRYVTYGPTPVTATGVEQGVFDVVLFSHEPMAVVVAPLVIATLVLGLLGQRRLHAELARLTLPLWLYVSISGLALWGLLYLR